MGDEEVRDFKWSPGMQRTGLREKNSRLGGLLDVRMIQDHW